jgi:hypothetical protein
MGEVPPGPDAVRAYLDSAVAEAADRWVGRAADATAYADLVAAVLARREALSPMSRLRDPYVGTSSPVDPERPRHYERRARPRWPLLGGAAAMGDAGGGRVTTARPPHTPADPVQPAPFTAALEVRAGPDLPTRPPGRHRLPPPGNTVPQAIDLNENLNTVLHWLGRPES